MSYSSRLDNVLQQIETIEDNLNKNLIQDFSKYLISKDTSANYQRNCIKIMLMFADFLQSRKEVEKNLAQVNSVDDIIAFLDTRRKIKDEDPEQKWITTWNDYLWRIKIFYRWYYNTIFAPLLVFLPLCPLYLNILLVIVVFLNILLQITQINKLIINKQI